MPSAIVYMNSSPVVPKVRKEKNLFLATFFPLAKEILDNDYRKARKRLFTGLFLNKPSRSDTNARNVGVGANQFAGG